MDNTTEMKSEIQKMYDRAYRQGIEHVIKLCEVCLEGEQTLSYAIKKIKELTNEPPTTSNPGQVNDLT